MAQRCQIRTASKDDAESIYNLHTSSIHELCSTHYSEDEIRQWIDRQSLKKYQSFIERGVIFVGVIIDQIVGFGHLECCAENTGEICALYVSPSFSRKGIGDALLCYLESKAREKECRVIRVKSTLNAKTFYEAKGYQSIQEDVHVVGDRSLSCVLMLKTLE